MKCLEKYYPRGYADSVFNIDYDKLYSKGCRGIIFDIDNTLVHHGDGSTPEVDSLFVKIHKAGLKTLLLTNNDEERVLRFIKNIKTEYICDAEKPEPHSYIKALKKLGIKRSQAIVIGDQLFTDILGANRCGIPGILVKFIRLPEEKRIGKRRYLEKLIMWSWRHSSYKKLKDIYI